AAVVLWVRGYHPRPSTGTRDPISFTHADPYYWIVSHPGSAVLCRQKGRNWNEHDLGGFGFAGVSFSASSGDDGSRLSNLIVPYWMITTIILLLPIARAEAARREHRRRRRESRGLCP